MGLEEKLREDLKEAMRKGDVVKRSTLRLVLAGIKNAEKAQGASLDDSAVLGVIAKEVRQRRESIDAFTPSGRQDLVAQEKAELDALLAYLPQQLTRDEIAIAARKLIEEVGARGPQDKGKVIPKLVAQLKGRAEGSEISAVVSELLAGS